jgi:hypothetical protein
MASEERRNPAPCQAIHVRASGLEFLYGPRQSDKGPFVGLATAAWLDQR